MHHPRQDSTYHGLCYTSRGEIAQCDVLYVMQGNTSDFSTEVFLRLLHPWFTKSSLYYNIKNFKVSLVGFEPTAPTRMAINSL